MKNRHFFHPAPHIMVQSGHKGVWHMEREEERDIDDLIFGDEEWHPSER